MHRQIMIEINSNCSRVDAVKASATQLKMQVDQVPHRVPMSDPLRKAQAEIQSLDTQVKNGDARKAEAALSTAQSAVKMLQTQAPAAASLRFQRGVDAYA